MSTDRDLINHNLRPQRKLRPAANNSKYKIEKDSENRVRKRSNHISKVEKEDKTSLITMRRITTQTGIFNLAKVSKTVSRGPQQDNSMMDQENDSIVSRVITKNNQNIEDFSTQEHSYMDISKHFTPKTDDLDTTSSPPSQEPDSSSSDMPYAVSYDTYKEIEHTILHSVKPEIVHKCNNALALMKRDLHATIKRNMPPDIYKQFFGRTVSTRFPEPTPTPPTKKKNMPLQPSNLDNLPKNQGKTVSEWTVLMGSFSSQDEDDSCMTDKIDCKSMMETDVPLSQHSGNVYEINKPDYLNSPAPVTMYPQKMF